MKKLISVFAALALVGSVAAQKKAAKAPAAAPAAPAAAPAPAPAAPAVAAAPASREVASGTAMGLRFGLSFNYATDLFKQGDNLKKLAGAAGGGAAEKAYSNANSAPACVAVTGVAGSSNCSASGSGDAVSLNGLDIGLRVEYDILPWLFVRTGGNYILGLKNTYELTTRFTSGGVDISDKSTVTANGSIIEIPLLIGVNLIQNDSSSFYFAGGVAYNIASFDYGISTVRTQSAGTPPTFTDVNNTTKLNGLGIMWLVGGRTKIASGLSLFGEVKYLSAAAVKAGAVTGTTNEAGKTYATGSNTAAGFFSAAGADLPAVIQGTGSNYGGSATGTGGLDLSYVRWQIGVTYDL